MNSEYADLLFPGGEYRAFWGINTVKRKIGHSGSDPGVQTDIQFFIDSGIGKVVLCNVNAEDNEQLWDEYSQIITILDKHSRNP